VISAGSVKTFRNASDVQNDTAGQRKKSNLREQRRDPWYRANVPPKAGADPALSGQDADNILRRALTWFAGRWRNHQPKRAEKPHSKSSGGNALDGPATRPDTPLAVENSVGKPAARFGVAPNAGTGKRAWRTPITRFGPCLNASSDRDFLFGRKGPKRPSHRRTLLRGLWRAGRPPSHRLNVVGVSAGDPLAGFGGIRAGEDPSRWAILFHRGLSSPMFAALSSGPNRSGARALFASTSFAIR